MKIFFFTYIFILFSFMSVFGQEKTINAYFTTEKPRIDGLLSEDFWSKAPKISDFFQYEPYNGQKASQKTIVKFAYGKNAIYIAAICKTTKKIYDILSKRDDFGQSDYFGFYLDPYNTGISGYGFFVTAAGVQIDVKVDNFSQNFDWDAVWFSRVTKTDSDYIVEMKIPYSAFRFPKKNIQNWNINFYRNIQQDREIDTWNYVNNSKNGIINQMGIVKNLNNIVPAIHLDLMPHFSFYAQKYSNLDNIAKSYIGGLDIKYSINESFTLDMMLIPDFGQVQSDEQVLNLSPYETYYNEKRFFFTEGTEIFNKGNIFYSRRIGRTPTKYKSVDNMLNKNEVILQNPEQTQIYNATKISGKTNKGIGIGVLNAFTGNTYAQIIDTVNNKTRKILTEPFANYNVLALNFPIPHNSYLSLTNTNFAALGRNYISDVWAQESTLRTKSNNWALFERFSQSNIFDDTTKADKGFAYRISISKTSGKFRVSASQSAYNQNYNPNDLGFLRRNNILSNSISFAYNIYKPFGKFLRWRNSLSVTQQRLFDNKNIIGTTYTLQTSTKLKNYTSLGTRITVTPTKIYDYFEPRVQNKFYVKDPSKNITSWISTNYANPFAYDFLLNYYFSNLSFKSQYGLSFTYSPRFQLSQYALIVLSQQMRYDFNNIGYVGKTASEDSIFFGKRNIKYNTQTIQFDYIFTKNISLNMKIRHYWSTIDYYDYYTLANNGKLYPLKYSYHFINNADINYNAFTVDLIFKWIFSPGSEFSIVYKKNITSTTNNIIKDYYSNFENMYFNSPRLNSISFKLIIYINYHNFK